MMNSLWAGMVLFSIVTAFFSNNTSALTEGILDGASESVELILSLTGALAFWSGMAKIAEESGFTKPVRKLLSPFLGAVFPDLDKNSEAFCAISMNVTANLLGLGNAATPLGLRAMGELQKENPGDSNTASREMIRFVVLNTASVQLIPTMAATMRARAGSSAPFDILVPVWISSLLSVLAGLGISALFTKKKKAKNAIKKSRQSLYMFALPGFVSLLAISSDEIFRLMGNAALPLAVGGILLWAVCKRTKVFDCFLIGAKEGLHTAMELLPSLCALVCAVSMLTASGALSLLVRFLTPVGSFLGIPSELLPLCLLRPLSGSGGLSVYQNILKTYGADSLLGRQAAVISGASETTFYAITIYYGSIGVENTGCTLFAALAADLVCYLAAVRTVH